MNGGLAYDAMCLARARHAGQRYGAEPYLNHLAHVVAIQSVWLPDPDPAILAAGWLHDVVEDTNVTFEELEQLFGPRVRALVEACSPTGRIRREKADDLIRRLLERPEALKVKLPDRLANVMACWRDRDTRLFMYQREYRGFRTRLRSPSLATHPDLEAIWSQLDERLGWWPPEKPPLES